MKYPGDLLAGRFAYEFPDGSRLYLNRQFGWCESCLRFVAMEDLSATELEADLESLKAELATHKGILKALSRASKTATASLTQRIAKIEKHLLFLGIRTSPPKCLSCGSENVHPFPKPKFSRTPQERMNAGWLHPLCGGSMVTFSQNLFVQDVYPLLIYNANGMLIKEEEEEW